VSKSFARAIHSSSSFHDLGFGLRGPERYLTKILPFSTGAISLGDIHGEG
jgi:hypothetical protein